MIKCGGMGMTFTKGRQWLADPELRAFQQEGWRVQKATEHAKPGKKRRERMDAKARWERWLKTP